MAHDVKTAEVEGRRAGWLTGLGLVGFFGLLALVAVLSSRKAEGQVYGGGGVPVPFVVAGGLDGSRWAYRVWSDGRVEVNDAADQLGNGSPEFKGWREVK